MNIVFINELTERLQNIADDIRIGDQDMVREMLEDSENEFPMICFEHTDDSDIEVGIDESKFLNDSVHEGDWIVGSSGNSILFIVNLSHFFNNLLEIDVLEVNNTMRGDGIGAGVVSAIEDVSDIYFNGIIISPFDTSAMNFWEHMDYEESYKYAGYYIKKTL